MLMLIILLLLVGDYTAGTAVDVIVGVDVVAVVVGGGGGNDVNVDYVVAC